jgi:acyl-CoA dehydrogenase
MDPVLYDSFDRLLSDISTPQVIREIESGGSPDALEQQIMESGFADAMVSEDAGGASLSLAEAFSLFFLCGRHALPVALAPTMIARAVLARQGVDIPQHMIAISNIPISHTDDTIECRNVPYGKLAQWVIVPHAGPSTDLVDLLLPVDKAERVDTGVHGSLQAHTPACTVACKHIFPGKRHVHRAPFSKARIHGWKWLPLSQRRRWQAQWTRS